MIYLTTSAKIRSNLQQDDSNSSNGYNQSRLSLPTTAAKEVSDKFPLTQHSPFSTYCSFKVAPELGSHLCSTQEIALAREVILRLLN